MMDSASEKKDLDKERWVQNYNKAPETVSVFTNQGEAPGPEREGSTEDHVPKKPNLKSLYIFISLHH